ncbi:DUF4280 domain-containing protein [Paenibacillus melissococcoides]|uniref:DUF4280 domain-containing protein n=2 Tax=Paenibacillus melissococcoides TaxID=2912268 RepID=A0ABN8U4M3_9BACL|nr:DUF4280 domain-containing protein [Paenibacillus melissococcoides]MEB9895676.1 DUF4280 domain-containing protein [Bacillus cereus]CAH8244563.1 DUF4280 domain-containing protein [Paenibacillus melissococcoides]CAH8708354.1 DUF4280 domain-containing protein [Paenibacillus melissococcoides]CAH8709062.1 DUF4280 domain-containing protein [Paenibacillus melissococcoides]
MQENNNGQLKSGSGDKKSYVVAGAILKCSFGTQPTRLKTPLSHGVYIKNKAQMNIKDYKPGVNIIHFGNCSSPDNPAVQNSSLVDVFGVKKAPCIPLINMPWLNGKSDVLVENEPALLNTCTTRCIHCGLIQIENDGQNLE